MSFKSRGIRLPFQEQNANVLVLIKPIFIAFWSFSLVFLICEFGQMLTDHFDQLGDAITDCDWTLFPKGIQKILPIVIQNTQREVVLETFENAACNRESFKMVCYLYWMTSPFVTFDFILIHVIRWSTVGFLSSWCFANFDEWPMFVLWTLKVSHSLRLIFVFQLIQFILCRCNYTQ